MDKTVLITEQKLQDRLKESLKQRYLPDIFLYMGAAGADKWLQLEGSEQFKVASSLTKFLKENARAIMENLPRKFTLASIGCGDAGKELIFLKTSKNKKINCHLIDISESLVEAGLMNLNNGGFRARGFVADLEELAQLAAYWPKPVVLSMFGNLVCNYELNDISGKLKSVMDEGDHFLFDCEIYPELTAGISEKIIDEYGSKLNREFNSRLLAELGLNENEFKFEIELLEVGPGSYRTRKIIRILKDCRLRLDSEIINFTKDEIIKMGFTYKYCQKDLKKRLERDFVIEKWLISENGRNLLGLLRRR